jgi:hypothetical protein
VVNALHLGLVTSGSVGWKTVRTRWETDLADYAPTLHHIEDHARWASRLTERHAKSVGLALSGRAAARKAIRSGANVVLLSTLQNAPFVPLPPAVNYIVYGDCSGAVGYVSDHHLARQHILDRLEVSHRMANSHRLNDANAVFGKIVGHR